MAELLLVEDEPGIAVLTKMMLEKNGYDVKVAKNNKECFKMIKKGRPDLIIMDVMMPDGSGWDTCRKIKENDKTKDIPILMYTVRSSEESVEKSLKHALADAHINKPSSMEVLLDTVERLLGNNP
jgi:DNA-binding response OmpR family regulator